MNYKKVLSLIIALAVFACLTACQANNNNQQESNSQSSAESESANESRGSDESSDSSEEDTSEAVEIDIISLEKALHTYFEWEDGLDNALVKVEHSAITLGKEDAESFPELAEALNQIAVMQENSMLGEFDNLVSFAKEELNSNRDSFETYVSTLDVRVRRADSVAVSLLSDTYSDYGEIENYRGLHGSNYDTQSGKALLLSDVVKDVNNALAEAVEKELAEHMLIGEFYSESTVEDYFANAPYDISNWTLDYTGITFYFAPDELCESDIMCATVTFAEYPELFNEKYMLAPEEYAVELSLDLPLYTELYAEDTLDAISASGYYDEDRDRYTKYGVYNDMNDQYYEEDCFVYDFHPYYVRSAKGNYLYLFCEDFDEGVRQMKLVVLSFNKDGSITKSGDMSLTPSRLADNKFIVPTNPNQLILDDSDNNTEREIYSVGNDGIPNK